MSLEHPSNQEKDLQEPPPSEEKINEEGSVTLEKIHNALGEVDSSNAQLTALRNQLDAASPDERKQMEKNPKMLGQLSAALSALEGSAGKAKDLTQKFLDQQGVKELPPLQQLEMTDPKLWEEAMKSFGRMPNIEAPMQLKIGDSVKYPESKDNQALADWQVIHAEKGHCLLMRRDAKTGAFKYGIFSEKSILEHNKDKEKAEANA